MFSTLSFSFFSSSFSFVSSACRTKLENWSWFPLTVPALLGLPFFFFFPCLCVEADSEPFWHTVNFPSLFSPFLLPLSPSPSGAKQQESSFGRPPFFSPSSFSPNRETKERAFLFSLLLLFSFFFHCWTDEGEDRSSFASPFFCSLPPCLFPPSLPFQGPPPWKGWPHPPLLLFFPFPLFLRRIEKTKSSLFFYFPLFFVFSFSLHFLLQTAGCRGRTHFFLFLPFFSPSPPFFSLFSFWLCAWFLRRR